MGDDLLQRAVALRLVAQALAQGVSDSAARIAQTMDGVARVQDVIALNGVSTTAQARAHAEHAQRARRFAEHERTDQQRWSHIADAGGQG